MIRLPDPTRIAPMTRRVIVWVVVLLVFAGLFVLVLRLRTPRRQRRNRRSAEPRGFGFGDSGHCGEEQYRGLSGGHRHGDARLSSSITSQVTGLVMAVHYREGQRYARAIR